MEKNQASFRFYEELNDFLPVYRRKTSFTFIFKGNPPIKSVIEEIGVPHVEVDLILVNGNSESFSYSLKNGDNVSVYPEFESIDITNVQRLRPKPLRKTKFILDAHLGRLAKYIRLCGFDANFKEGINDREIVKASVEERRIILTRDRELLKARLITHGYWVRSSDPSEQLKEVIRRFDLKNSLNPFSRCIECNGMLEKVEKESVMNLLLPRTRDFYNDFWKCKGCNRIYWEGSHFEKMKKFIESLLS